VKLIVSIYSSGKVGKEIVVGTFELGWNEGLSEAITVGIVNDVSNKVHTSNKINIERSSSLDKLMRITNTMTSSKQSSVDNNISNFQSFLNTYTAVCRIGSFRNSAYV
jgi:hypothetical protein